MAHIWYLETLLFLVDQFHHGGRVPRSCAETLDKKSIDATVLQGLVKIGSDKVARFVDDKIIWVKLDDLSPTRRWGTRNDRTEWFASSRVLNFASHVLRSVRQSGNDGAMSDSTTGLQ